MTCKEIYVNYLLLETNKEVNQNRAYAYRNKNTNIEVSVSVFFLIDSKIFFMHLQSDLIKLNY